MKSRHWSAPACLLFLASSALAGGLQPLGTDGKTVGEVLGRARAASAARASVRGRHAISLDTSLPGFIFQGAGSLSAGNGAFIRSDVMLANYRNVTQTIAIAFLAQGVDNSNEVFQYFTIPANGTVALDDFVAVTLHRSGLGAVVILGVDAQHNLDSDARLDGQSRIWSLQPGSSGKVSLGLPSVDLIDAVGSSVGYALGMRQDASAHTNVGIVNLDTVTHTWTVQALGLNKTSTFSVTVPPFSVNQVAIPAGSYGDLFLAFTPDADGFEWSGFASSTDNVTGDGWVSHVNQPLS